MLKEVALIERALAHDGLVPGEPVGVKSIGYAMMEKQAEQTSKPSTAKPDADAKRK